MKDIRANHMTTSSYVIMQTSKNTSIGQMFGPTCTMEGTDLLKEQDKLLNVEKQGPFGNRK